MYDTLLVPTDGSAAATTAVEQALTLAAQFDATLHAIHVVDRTDYPVETDELAAELAERGTETVDAISERAAEQGVECTTEVLDTDNPVHEALIEDATDHNVDLIVMGTRGRTGLNRLVLGSVAERTLRASPIPVLTVHESADTDQAFERILVPTDGSNTASLAATHAIQVAAEADAALHIVHVVDLTAVSGEYGTGRILETMRTAGQQAVDELVDQATEADISTVEASILSGSPSRAVIDYATDRDVDCIVMGTHGRSGLDRLLLGSVTEKVVRLAEMPVLSVSPQNGQ